MNLIRHRRVSRINLVAKSKAIEFIDMLPTRLYRPEKSMVAFDQLFTEQKRSHGRIFM